MNVLDLFSGIGALDYTAGMEVLPKGFCVHHINLQKDDNAPLNLEICDHPTHQKYHSQLEELAVKLLLEAGKIKFVSGVGYVETT